MARFLIIFSLFLFASCAGVSERARELYSQGVASWENNNHADAISLLSRATTESSSYYEAHLKLGEYHLASGEYSNATDSLTTAISLRKESYQAHTLLGQVYLQQQKYLKGQHHFSQAIRLGGATAENFGAYLGKGICKIEQTLYEDAQEYLEKASSLKPDSIDAVFYTAVLWEKQMGGPNGRSLAAYQNILKKKSNHLGALRQIGNTWQVLDSHSKAHAYYQKFLAAGGKSQTISKYIQKVNAEKKRQKEKLRREQLAKKAGEKNIGQPQNPPQQPKKEEPAILTCPECNRFYKSGHSECDFDGTPLTTLQQ